MKNSTLIILIALILSNCQKTEIDCSKKESYLEQCKISGKVKSIKSRAFELIETNNGNYEKGKEKLTFFGHRYDKEINPSGYLVSWTNYENNTKEIKTKNVYSYNSDNIKTSEIIYDQADKVTFKRIIDVENNLAIKMTDFNENGKIESYSENELNDIGQITKQIQFKDINKKQKNYSFIYKYKDCKISKCKTLDRNNEIISEIEYRYNKNEMTYLSSKDKSGLNTYIIKRNEIEPKNFESIKTDKDGKVISEKLEITDNFNNIIKEIKNDKVTLENIYTYDNKNNWITMKRFKNNKPFEIVIRNIEYYK
ncbi:hypothetical protein FG167_11155 [Lacinutrix sp. WUR7]|uniref:hypothetical protein n=1 Tax=Lacinutrix sp. WUR7 TaxID=2653681 RepID=UPI00193D4A0A|nr:hypothetical protein [Lacinutrix sp. WUR7]QRM89749.1 hypothetical protein FG167_11100 [Lacinutrix sp. WUR7]QRM89760.1 hypothetical protein FG167_11155 [Lacinutrix sp. WUR7]